MLNVLVTGSLAALYVFLLATFVVFLLNLHDKVTEGIKFWKPFLSAVTTVLALIGCLWAMFMFVFGIGVFAQHVTGGVQW